MNKNNLWFNVAIVSFAIFFIALVLVAVDMPRIDSLVSDYILNLGQDSVKQFFILFNFHLDKILLGLAVFVISILFFRERKKESLILFFSLIVGYAWGSLTKIFVHRPRPILSFVQETGYSFPSNHATFSVILFSLIIYFFARRVENILVRKIFIFINVLFILLTCFSRIYLNVHWFTDVVGGFALGVFIVSVVILFLKSLNTCARQGHMSTTNF